MQQTQHDVSAYTLAKVAAAVGVVWLLTQLWPILLVIVGSLFLVGTLSPLVAALERRGIRRTWALVVVFLSLLLLVLGAGLVTLPALGRELLDLLQNAPQTQAHLAAALERNRLTAPLAETVRRFQPQSLFSRSPGQTLAYSRRALQSFGYTMSSIVLALYLLADRDRARGALYAWVPRSHHVRLARVLLNLETIVGGYIRGQIITSVAIGVFVLALLTICRVPNALALACFAGLTDVIPYVGGLLATAPAVFATMAHGPGMALLVLAAMVLYQSFESRVLVPWIYGRVLRLPSAVVVIALLIGAELLGMVGALLALPVAAGIRMMIEELRVELPGDDSDDSERRARDARVERIYAARSAGAAPEEAAAVAVAIADQIQKTDGPNPLLTTDAHFLGTKAKAKG